MSKIITLDDVSKLMDEKRPSPTGMYVLCAHDGRIELVKGKVVPPGSIKIANVGAFDINHGLSSSMWNEINRKILVLIKEKKL